MVGLISGSTVLILLPRFSTLSIVSAVIILFCCGLSTIPTESLYWGWANKVGMQTHTIINSKAVFKRIGLMLLQRKKQVNRYIKAGVFWHSVKNWGLSAAALPSAFDGAFRSTPQPPHMQYSFARQIFYGGFAGYLLLSHSPSAVESLLGFYHTICFLQRLPNVNP